MDDIVVVASLRAYHTSESDRPDYFLLCPSFSLISFDEVQLCLNDGKKGLEQNLIEISEACKVLGVLLFARHKLDIEA